MKARESVPTVPAVSLVHTNPASPLSVPFSTNTKLPLALEPDAISSALVQEPPSTTV